MSNHCECGCVVIDDDVLEMPIPNMTLPRYQHTFPGVCRQGDLISYAWPGGYPLVYMNAWGWCMCPSCANKTEDNARDPENNVFDVEMPDYVHVHLEGPPIECDLCSAMIESAHGDPEEDEHACQLG